MTARTSKNQSKNQAKGQHGGTRAGAGRKRGSVDKTPRKLRQDKPALKHGGSRAGAGRKPDAVAHKLTEEKLEFMERVKEIGDPVEYLLTIVADKKQPQPIRMQAAAIAAPYVRPRLQAVAVAEAVPAPDTFLRSLPSGQELRLLVRGADAPALPAPAIAEPPAADTPPPPRKPRKPSEAPRIWTPAKPLPPPGDKLAPYRDQRMDRGGPYSPLEPDFP